MRFRRWPRVAAYEDAPRKRTALARTQRRQRKSRPVIVRRAGEPAVGADPRLKPVRSRGKGSSKFE
jgi:hypothetical protein